MAAMLETISETETKVRAPYVAGTYKKECAGEHNLYGVQHIHINLTLIHCTFYRYADADQKLVLTGTSIPL